MHNVDPIVVQPQPRCNQTLVPITRILIIIPLIAMSIVGIRPMTVDGQMMLAAMLLLMMLLRMLLMMMLMRTDDGRDDIGEYDDDVDECLSPLLMSGI